MPKGYKIIDQYAPHFLTFTIVGWVDIFTRREMKEMVIVKYLDILNHGFKFLS